MAGRGLERRDEREPDCETDDRPDQCADRADDRAVGQQHEPEVLLGRADRRERAELAEPSLGDDGKPCGGNQRGHEQEDGGHGEHRQRVCPPVALPGLGPYERGPLAGVPIHEGADRVGAGVDQDRRLVRRSRRRGGDEGELVAQITWVLDDADDGPATPVESQRVPELESEQCGHAVRDGDLARASREATAEERKPSAPVRSARVLGAELHRIDATGDGQGAMTDDVDSPEPFPGGRETLLEPARIGAVEPEQMIGGAELGVVRGTGVVGDRDAGDRGRSRDGEESDHQDLLAPLAAEHAPGPPDDRAARGNAAVSRPRPRQAVSDRRHRRAPAARSDSAPGGATVWSTTWPSRRKTTRSAHEARCASWVTTTPATPRRVAARSSRMTVSPFTESSAPVGSSASSSPRSPTIARVIATRWRSPPDSSSA